MAVKVEGLRDLNRALTKTGADVEDLKDLNQDISQLVVQTAQSLVTVVSGDLRSSIKGNRAKGKAVVKAGGARIPYAGPIHWGWPKRGIAPSMFLADAVDQNTEQITHKYQDGIDKVLRKNGLK